MRTEKKYLTKQQIMADGGYYVIPNMHTKCGKQLTDSQHRFLSTLWTFANEDKDFMYPTQTHLASYMGKSKRQIRNIAKQLEKKGLLEVRRKKGRNNTYYLLIPPNIYLQYIRELHDETENKVKGEKEERKAVRLKTAEIQRSESGNDE